MRHPIESAEAIRRAVESIAVTVPTCSWRHPRTGCLCGLHARPGSGRCAMHGGAE